MYVRVSYANLKVLHFNADKMNLGEEYEDKNRMIAWACLKRRSITGSLLTYLPVLMITLNINVQRNNLIRLDIIKG